LKPPTLLAQYPTIRVALDVQEPDAFVARVTSAGAYDQSSVTLSMGTDHDTASFAVSTIRRCWHSMGKSAYPEAKKLMIMAAAVMVRAWKHELQRFADEENLTTRVSHFPPGTSNWNKIEHRLFSHVSMN
jgi:hypothetical protein